MLSIKTAILGSLYFCQGLPYGLQDKLLPLILRSKGVSYTGVSLIRLLWLPWVFKVLFAPCIDRVWSKTAWLFTCLSLLCILSIITSFIEPENLLYLSVLLFLFNLLSAIQDISVDALAIDILDDAELGTGNAAQVGGYKIGALFGGGILFWLITRIGWSGAYFCLAGINLLIGVVCFILFRNKKYNDVMKLQTKQTTNANEFDKSRKWYQILNDIFASPGTLHVVVFILIYKLGEQGSLGNFPMFLLDRKMETGTLSFWFGVIGQILSLIGSLFGGRIIADSRGIKTILWYFCFLRTIPLAIQWFLTLLWPNDPSSNFLTFFYYCGIFSLCLLQFLGGVVTTATFTLMMSSSQKSKLQATHFTTLASIEVFGKLFFSSFMGTMFDIVTAPVMYFIFILLNICAVVCIPSKFHTS